MECILQVEQMMVKVQGLQKEEAMHFEETERLVTEIEMLKVVLYLVVRRRRVSLLLYQVRG
jgi:hypothetical protein